MRRDDWKIQKAKKQQSCPACVSACVGTSFRDHDEIDPFKAENGGGVEGIFHNQAIPRIELPVVN